MDKNLIKKLSYRGSLEDPQAPEHISMSQTLSKPLVWDHTRSFCVETPTHQHLARPGSLTEEEGGEFGSVGE